MQQRGEIHDFKTQHPIEINVNGQYICTHFVDFLVTRKIIITALGPDYQQEFHEAKGYETDLWQIKRKLVKALFPETPYIVIKRRDNPWKKKIFRTRKKTLAAQKSL